MSDYRTIEVTRTGGVGRLTFDRPDAHNALNERMAEELVDAVRALVSDDDVRCIAVTADGPTAAYAATKRLLVESYDRPLGAQLAAEADAIAGLTDTEDFARGHAAFDGDEKPEFVGE